MASLSWLEPRALARAPVETEHHALTPQQVVTAKVLSCCWLITGMVAHFPQVHAPWISWFTLCPPWWPEAMIAVSLTAALGVIFTPFIRGWAFVQAMVICCGLLSSRPSFAYHRLFAACFFIAIAAAGAGWRSRLPRLQVAVLYLGAGLDKALSTPWRDGSFLSSLIHDLAQFGRLWSPGGHVGEPNVVAGWLDALLERAPFVSTTLSAATIMLELFLAIAFGLGWRSAAWGSLALHIGIVLITGGTFGVFFHAGLAMALLVLPPRRALPVLLAAVLLSLPFFFPALALVVVAATVVSAATEQARPIKIS